MIREEPTLASLAGELSEGLGGPGRSPEKEPA
jgi:hypothetical protein